MSEVTLEMIDDLLRRLDDRRPVAVCPCCGLASVSRRHSDRVLLAATLGKIEPLVGFRAPR